MRDLNNTSKDILICGCYTIKDSDENDVTVTRPLFPLHIQEIMQYYIPGSPTPSFPSQAIKNEASKNGAKYFILLLFFSNQISPFLFREKTRQCQTGKRTRGETWTHNILPWGAGERCLTCVKSHLRITWAKRDWQMEALYAELCSIVSRDSKKIDMYAECCYMDE